MEESGELIEMVPRAYPLSTGTIHGMSEERKVSLRVGYRRWVVLGYRERRRT